MPGRRRLRCDERFGALFVSLDGLRARLELSHFRLVGRRRQSVVSGLVLGGPLTLIVLHSALCHSLLERLLLARGCRLVMRSFLDILRRGVRDVLDLERSA